MGIGKRFCIASADNLEALLLHLSGDVSGDARPAATVQHLDHRTLVRDSGAGGLPGQLIDNFVALARLKHPVRLAVFPHRLTGQCGGQEVVALDVHQHSRQIRNLACTHVRLCMSAQGIQ